MGRLKWPTDKVPLLTCNDSSDSHAFFTAEDPDQENDKDSLENNHKSGGYGWILASFYIVADIAGGGVVTLPKAFLNSGNYFIAIIITAIVCSTFCYTGIILGENWIMMLKRWPIYRKHCRKPYPEMAYRSLGRHARTLTAGTLHIMLYGVSIVYLLLSSKIINDLVTSAFNLRFGECRMLVLLSIALWPLVMCKSPQDFWWAVLMAMSTTLFAVILIVFGIISDSPSCQPAANLPEFKFSQMVMSLGIYMFSFGGHGVFPSIQQDMKNPKEFSKSTILAFFAVCALYLPVAFLAYSTYGDSIGESVINSLQSPIIQQFANLFIACHCILTLSIVINPLSNELEHHLNVAHEFGIQRIFVRTSLLITIVFAALTVPSFGPILNLIGGTTVALTSAVFPCLFNLCLLANENASRHEAKSWTGLFRLITQKTNPLRLIVNLSIIVLAIICGAITSKSALNELANSSFSVPCYFPSYKSEALTHVNCCGAFKNISVFETSSDFCAKSH